MLGVCSIMGLPWFVAATVLSITHVNSLKLESECSAPGEQPKFLGIREQRVTGLMIFILMGSSVFMTSILKVMKAAFMKLREETIYLLLFKKFHLNLSHQFANILRHVTKAMNFFTMFIKLNGGSYGLYFGILKDRKNLARESKI